MTEPENDTCARCGHPDGEHCLFTFEEPTFDNILHASGFVLCPHPDCQCYGTWSVQGAPRPTADLLPDTDTITRMRSRLQTDWAGGAD